MSIKTLLNSKVFLSIFASTVVLLAGVIVFASSEDDIVFPVVELGNCKSEQECRAYCDDPENIEVCLDFAKKHNLLSQEEIEKAEKFLAIGVGPGDCTNQFECESYCSDINNIDECLAFAERSGLMPPDELAEAKKVQAALKRGAKLPGNCRSKSQCEAYCSNSDNMEECVAFAEAAGFMPPEELAEAKKVLAAIRKGVKPPPCQGKESCDAYCMEPNHFEECLTFAEAAGLIPPEELAQAKQALSAIKKGVKPPPCRGKEECDRYCENNIEQCVAFAEAAGMMSPEEAGMARKTGGKGPGGCRGEQECRAFCENPANQEECFNFASQHGLISEEDKLRMQEGMAQMRQGLEQAPQQVRECLESKLGAQKIAEIQAGTAVVGPHMGDIMRECFEQFMPAPGEFGPPPEGFEQYPQGVPPQGIPSGFTGPGGCTSPEECQRYCSDPAHQQECGQAFPQEFQEQYQQQYEQQYQQQYQSPQEYQQPPEYQPPAEYQQPPAEQPQEPSSFRQLRQAAASLLTNFLNLLK